MWQPQEISPLGPVYVAIADALARDVTSGRLAPGERLPTHRALARDLGVNVVTITRAYQEAARRGLVEGEVGRGTFVADREARVLPGLPLGGAPENLIDLHFNAPVGDLELLDIEATLQGLARQQAAEHLASGYLPRGLEAHRVAGAAWMARSGLAADPDRVVVTAGVQHAMSIVFSTVLEPGDTLAVEELTYPGVKALAAMLHLKLAPLPLDGEGLDPDALERACKKGVVRALYLQPTIQNPTGRLLSAERRRRIAELAERYGLPVIEDDTAGYLLEDAPAPVCADLDGLGYFLAGTSKSIVPGLRVGYIHGPRASADRLAATVAANTWMTAPLMAELATRWIDSGQADAMVRHKRAEARARRELFARHLGRHPVTSHNASSHVWLPLPSPWRGEEFVAQARRAGVAPTPPEHFVVGRASAPHAVRLALGRPRTRAEVERGLALLAELLDRAPTCTSLV